MEFSARNTYIKLHSNRLIILSKLNATVKSELSSSVFRCRLGSRPIEAKSGAFNIKWDTLSADADDEAGEKHTAYSAK